MSTPIIQLAGLQTENRNPRTTRIDRVPTLELCRILNREDATVPSAVEPCLPVIAEVIDTLSERVRKGGRVFYIGAGTSGRLGVLDASEIPPTYSAPAGQFIALMAGGDYALRHAKEGAEDDSAAAEADLQPFNLDPAVDSLIGIASSGRTPYVLGGLSYFKSLGATTVGLVCVSPSAVETQGNADHLIAAVTGPEVVTGSTRMKAGTVTKLVLNMISSGIMIKLGKTYGNLMIDVKATNLKLKQRARNILRYVGGDVCTQSDEELDQILESCRGSVKLAAVVVRLKLSVAEAEERLVRNNGVLAHVFEEAEADAHRKEAQQEGHGQDDSLVLCIDAGGTSCKAVILCKDGEMGSGAAGPCNVTNIGVDAAMATISKAIQEAVDNCKATQGRQLQTIKLSAAWIGMAGYDRPSLSPLIDQSLSKLLGLPVGSQQLRITTDIDLLPACVTGGEDMESVVVVVAGTGSIAMSFDKVDGQWQRTHRVGGWGYLLGDDGSGYGIGREALRTALYSSDMYRMLTRKDHSAENATAQAHSLSPLSQAVFQHFQELYPGSRPEDLLSTVLVPDSASHGAQDGTLSTAKRIASVARVVLPLASSDAEARTIVETGVSRLVHSVALLVKTREINPLRSALVLSGGLTQDGLYRDILLKALEEDCGRFKQTEAVNQPAIAGAKSLLALI